MENDLQAFANEEWKWVKLSELGPNERYQISSYGRVRSYKMDKDQGRIIKGSNVGGYKAVPMRRKNGASITPYVHRLVAMHFIPNDDPDRIYVVHKNYNKKHNHVDNLKWVSRDEWEVHQQNNPNYQGHQLGRWRGPRNAKLTEDDVIRMKKMLKEGDNRLKNIAKEFGITHTQLNRIRRGENWGHVTIDE